MGIEEEKEKEEDRYMRNKEMRRRIRNGCGGLGAL